LLFDRVKRMRNAIVWIAEEAICARRGRFNCEKKAVGVGLLVPARKMTAIKRHKGIWWMPWC
jgi:hypothetical protein